MSTWYEGGRGGGLLKPLASARPARTRLQAVNRPRPVRREWSARLLEIFQQKIRVLGANPPPTVPSTAHPTVPPRRPLSVPACRISQLQTAGTRAALPRDNPPHGRGPRRGLTPDLPRSRHQSKSQCVNFIRGRTRRRRRFVCSLGRRADERGRGARGAGGVVQGAGDRGAVSPLEHLCVPHPVSTCNLSH